MPDVFECCDHCEHDIDGGGGDGYDPETGTHDEPCPYGCDDG